MTYSFLFPTLRKDFLHDNKHFWSFAPKMKMCSKKRYHSFVEKFMFFSWQIFGFRRIKYAYFGIYVLIQPFEILARLRQALTAFLLKRAITRHATDSITSELPCQSYMQNFIKIGVASVEKNMNKFLTLCN